MTSSLLSSLMGPLGVLLRRQVSRRRLRTVSRLLVTALARGRMAVLSASLFIIDEPAARHWNRVELVKVK